MLAAWLHALGIGAWPGSFGTGAWLGSLGTGAWLGALGTGAWLGALAVGLALGLLGSGGSILTVPLLVYVVGQPERVAIAGSLFIVGTISAVGALSYVWRRQVSWRNVAFFGVPGMFGTYAGAWLSAFVTSTLQLILFAVVMLLAAGFMLRRQKLKVDNASRHAPSDAARLRAGSEKTRLRAGLEEARLRTGPGKARLRAGTGKARLRALWKIALDGTLVGILTGLVGVGGGFLIIPALVLLGRLPMHHAVGTSLIIIALKSFSGFFKYVDVLRDQQLALDWGVLAVFASIGTIGSIVGSLASHLVRQDILRRVFGFLLIVVSAFILWNNLGSLPNRPAT